MAAWDDDLVFDRLEARGEADALDGVDPTEAFYSEWQQDDQVARELHRLLVEPLDLIVAMFEAPEGLSAGSSPARGHRDAA